MATKTVAGLIAALMAALVGGCGERTLNTDSIEPTIKDTIERSGAKVSEVDCPGDVTAKKGDSFDCRVALEGGSTVTVMVTQTDDQGKVKFAPKLNGK